MVLTSFKIAQNFEGVETQLAPSDFGAAIITQERKLDQVRLSLISELSNALKFDIG